MYLHRDGKAASAGFPAEISGRRESAAGKLGLLEEVWPFSPYVLKGSWRTNLTKTDYPPQKNERPNSLAGPRRSAQDGFDATPRLGGRRRGSAQQQDGERLAVCRRG